jgi:Cysteine-rich CPCC
MWALGGPNLVSLMEAHENFAAFGAAEQKDLAHVRPPLPAEIPGE